MSFPRYPKHKHSGVEWLGEVPEHWEMARIQTLFEIKKRIAGKLGFNVFSVTQNGIRIKDIESNEGQLSMDYSKYQIVETGDFAMNPMDLLTGGADIAASRGVTSPDYRVFSLRYPASCCDRFFLYLFTMMYRQRIFFHLGQGSSQLGRWRLPREEFNNFRFPVPSLNEQQTIAAFLDRETAKIDELVAEQRRLIELLKEKRQAVISHAVTKGLNPNVPMRPSGIEWLGEVPEHWHVTRVKRLTQILRGKFTHRPRHDPAMYGGPYPFIQTGEITQTSRFVGEYHQTLSEAGFHQSKQFPKGTLVMTITGAGTANVAILDYEACFPDSIVGFVPAKEVSLDYLYILFTAMRDALLETSVTNTQPNLNIERIGALATVQPPIDEQHEIVRHVNAMSLNYEFLTAEAERAIELLQERRTALISAAVTGKIDVRSFAERHAI